MARNFGNSVAQLTRAAAVTPSDSTDLSGTRALYVGGAGDVVVTMLNGGIVTFKAPPVGTVLNVSVSRVMAATTATLILALS
jgi:hypothetical protein